MNIGYIAALASGLLWALDGIFLSFLQAPSIIIAIFHDGLSFVFILFYLIISRSFKNITKIPKDSIKIIITASFFGGFIGMGSFIASIYYSGVSTAALFSSLYPIISIVLSKFFLKDRLKPIGYFGITIAVFASICLCFIMYEYFEFNALGTLFGFLCAIGWGTECVIINIALKGSIDTKFALFIRQGISFSCFLICFAILFMFFDDFYLGRNITIDIELSKIILASFFGTISYILYYIGIQKIGALRAMGLNISYSFWAILLSYFFGAKMVFAKTILSIILISGSLLSNL
jgi:integral membrane protein domain protein